LLQVAEVLEMFLETVTLVAVAVVFWKEKLRFLREATHYQWVLEELQLLAVEILLLVLGDLLL
jgi:undecaprenyl pyrophosphate phosphatase UppP